MLGFILILSAAYAECETSCYISCLAESDLTTCSKSCCTFKNILFEEDKVFYVHGDEKVEIELEPVYIEIPTAPTYKPKEHPAEPVLAPSRSVDPVTCEDKCLNYCKKTGSKCVDVCYSKHCISIPEPSSSIWPKAIISVTCLTLLLGYLRSKQHEGGYIRLD